MADESKAEGLENGAPKRGRGRPKGVKNKVTASAKDNLLAVFNRLGGTAWLAQFAKKHPAEFFRAYARLVPNAVDVDAKVDGQVTVELVRFTDTDTPSK